MSENTTLYESTSHWSQYSIKNNKKINNIGAASEEILKEELVDWGSTFLLIKRSVNFHVL